MRVDILTAHTDDLGESVDQIFGVNVYADPEQLTRTREQQDRLDRIERGKLSISEVPVEQTLVVRANREFPIFDGILTQTSTGDIVRLDQRPDGLWNIISNEEVSTYGVDEQELFSIVKPLEVAQ